MLEIVEVYATHDVPRLFLATNNLGQQFIALWVDYDDDTETWLYLPVSVPRLALLRSAEIELRAAFRDSELGYVWEVVLTISTGEWRARPYPAEKLQDERLPDPGMRLHVPADAPHDIRSASLTGLARGSKRDALAVALYFAHGYRYEAPIRELGLFMESFQDQLDVLAQQRRGKFGPGGAVTHEVRQQSEIVFESTFPSSFGMKMMASLPPDLAGESLVGAAIEDLMGMMSLSAHELPEFLKRVHTRVAVKYRRLLASLLDNQAGIRVTWQRPRETAAVDAMMTYARVREAFDVVSAVQDDDTRVFTVVGILNAVNLRTRTFELSAPDNRRRFSGKILAPAMGAASSATMSKLYEARIHMTIEVSTATGAERVYYFLEDLTPYGE